MNRIRRKYDLGIFENSAHIALILRRFCSLCITLANLCSYLGHFHSIQVDKKMVNMCQMSVKMGMCHVKCEKNKPTKMYAAAVKDPPILQYSEVYTRVLQNVLSLGSDYFSATFYQTYFYYKSSKYSPLTEKHFCNLYTCTQSRKADRDTDK